MPFCTYILYSTLLDRYYIGSTSDIAERIKKHNSNHEGFTGKVNDWCVVWTEPHASKEDAGKREREIKGWKSRKMVERLVNNE